MGTKFFLVASSAKCWCDIDNQINLKSSFSQFHDHISDGCEDVIEKLPFWQQTSFIYLVVSNNEESTFCPSIQVPSGAICGILWIRESPSQLCALDSASCNCFGWCKYIKKNYNGAKLKQCMVPFGQLQCNFCNQV